MQLMNDLSHNHIHNLPNSPDIKSQHVVNHKHNVPNLLLSVLGQTHNYEYESIHLDKLCMLPWYLTIRF